jgi:O-antigen/teichoic acid export membrane protein
MQLHTFGKNTFFLFASQAFAAAITIAILPLLARYLGIAGYGRYVYVYAFVGLFETLSVFGVHQIFVREVAQRRDRAPIYLGNILRLKIPLSLGVFALIFLASNIFVRPDLHVLVIICASEVLLRKFFLINLALSRAFERMEYEFVVTVLERAAVVVGILLVIKFDWGLTGIFLAFLFAAVVHSLFGTLLVWRRLVQPSFARVQGLKKSILLNSWPIGLSREAEVLYNRVGTVLLGQWCTPQVVGAYSGGFRIYEVVSLVVANSISRSAFPALSRLNKDPHQFTHFFYRIVCFNACIAILLAAAMWVLSPFIIRILLGPEFEPSLAVLRWISLAIPFAFLNRLFGVTLYAANHQLIDAFLTVCTFSVNLALNWALISSLGAIGAVWALMTAEFFSFVSKGCVLATLCLPRINQKAQTRS